MTTNKLTNNEILEQIEYDFVLLVAIYIAGIDRMLAINISSGKNRTVESTILPP